MGLFTLGVFFAVLSAFRGVGFDGAAVAALVCVALMVIVFAHGARHRKGVRK